MQLHPPSPGFASAAVFVSASAWGLYWMPLRYLEGLGLDGAWAVALLNIPAALLLAVIVALFWQRMRGHLRAALLIGLLAGFGLALYGTGLIYSSVVRATLLFYLTPVWATLIGIIWLGERAGWQRWAAIIAGLAGMVLLLSGGGSVPLNIGDLYAFFSGIFWACGAALILWFGAVPLSLMMLFQFLATALGALLLGWLAAGIAPLPAPLALDLAPVVALISIAGILPAVMILFWAQKFLFPGRVGLLMMSEVLVAVITASLLLPEESLSALEWSGAVLIITACLGEVFCNPQSPG